MSKIYDFSDGGKYCEKSSWLSTKASKLPEMCFTLPPVVLFTTEIAFTDFPLDQISLYELHPSAAERILVTCSPKCPRS